MDCQAVPMMTNSALAVDCVVKMDIGWLALLDYSVDVCVTFVIHELAFEERCRVCRQRQEFVQLNRFWSANTMLCRSFGRALNRISVDRILVRRTVEKWQRLHGPIFADRATIVAVAVSSFRPMDCVAPNIST